MVFAFMDIANYAGRPTLLVDFERGLKVWRYTAADRNVTFNSNVYTAVPLSIGEISQTGDTQADEVTITMPANEEMPALFVNVPPANRVRVTVRRFHQGDTDAGIRYVGYVDRVRRITPLKAEVKCKALAATLRRSGARLSWQRSCPHVLYDGQCGVNKAAFAASGTVAALDSQNLIVNALGAYANDYFSGGMIEWEIEPGVQSWRTITGHVSTGITVLGGTYGFEVGNVVTVYPGCQRTAEECDVKFNNLSRFGGIRHLPQKSPFNGDPVF